MLGILARVNVSYLNADDLDPTRGLITEVYHRNTLDIDNDPIFEGRTLLLLNHSIDYSGSCGYHYYAL